MCGHCFYIVSITCMYLQVEDDGQTQNNNSPNKSTQSANKKQKLSCADSDESSDGRAYGIVTRNKGQKKIKYPK